MRGDEILDLGSPQQQAVLIMLLAGGGNFVRSADLVDGLWGEHAPATSETVIRTYISRLRRLLSTDDKSVITFQSGSYLIDASLFVLDAAEFGDLIKVARQYRADGELTAAVAELERSLSFWTGTALAGVPGEAAERERFRLEQLKLTASKELLECRLDLGQHAEVVAEVPLLIQLNPLEEPLYEIYLLALYRSGRRAEALDVYRMLYDLLSTELGISPGAGVQAIHEKILRSEPEQDDVLVELRGSRSRIERQPLRTPRVDHASSQPAAGASHTGWRFVGRHSERTMFQSLLATGPRERQQVLFFHGPAGIGKSSLVRQLAADAVADGYQAWLLSGKSTSDLQTELNDVISETTDVATPVLLIDSPPDIGELEPWLLCDWLPKLPVDAVVVLAARCGPSAGWRTDPRWAGAIHCRRLEGLLDAEAAELVEGCGAEPDAKASITDFADGNPFAVVLSSEVSRTVTANGQLSRRDAARYVVDTLVTTLAGDAPSALHRKALHICAHARSTTEDLLREVMPAGDSAELFDWLRSHPGVEAATYGLEINGVLREALDDHLRWRDPEGYRSMHRTIRDYVLGKALRDCTEPYALIEAVRAIGHLCRAGGVSSRYVSWAGGNDIVGGTAGPDDQAELVGMAREFHGDTVAQSVQYWFGRRPEAFHVLKCRTTGRLRGFSSWLTLESPAQDEIEADPQVGAIWRDVHDRMEVPAGRHIGIARHLISPVGQAGPSPVVDAMRGRMIRSWLHDDRLVASYLVAPSAAFWRGSMEYFGQYELNDAAIEHPGAIFGHDWLAEPRVQWLEEHLDERMGAGPGLRLFLQPSGQ
ncbi:BTAD domain-containing putative transcriptional regulator [Kribbella sp. NPDC051587]|uniref:BTAD domain-containing putative transcriptional regulator n=1 Tax=Kribbella sp. NPDC051587 TaxID=3364119 RepID=UPI0037B4FF80